MMGWKHKYRKKNTEAVLEAIRVIGLEINTEKTKYTSCYVLLPECRKSS
jgi:hypothetical protein